MSPGTRLLLSGPAWTEPDGAVDWPLPGGSLQRGVIELCGWALFPSGPTARVEVSLGGHPLGRARLCVRRGDVRDASANPLGEAAGFEMTVSLAEWPGEDGEAPLAVTAVGIDGERFDLPTVPVTVAPPPAPAPGPEPKPGRLGSRVLEGDGPRVLVSTHQLDLGGAQLQLTELLEEMIRLGTIDPTVVSAFDGPLRGRLEALGVPVHVTSLVPVDNLASRLGRIEELTAWAARQEFDLAFVNTSTAYALPGAEVAETLGIPAVWLIHESFEPAELWKEFDPEVRRRAERTLANADLAIFEADATRALYEPLIGAERCLTVPYGLDLVPVEKAREGFDRDAARRRAGLPEDAEVILCVGSVEPRKAQIPLALAFDLLAAEHPRAHLVLVGARKGDPYTRFLEATVATLDSAERIAVVPMTSEVQPWFGLSDLLVCASDIESLPRTVIEAMAWEVPVLATGIFGLPEVIEDGVNGWLCQERDTAALADGLSRALGADPEERRRVGEAGRELVLSGHRIEPYARELAGLLAGAAGSGSAGVGVASA